MKYLAKPISILEHAPKYYKSDRMWWLMPVTPSTWEVEIRNIVV
jgi:hypothetical protein